MNVIVAAGGRFHSLHLAHELERHKVLKTLFTSDYHNSDNDYVSRKLVRNNKIINILDKAYMKLRLSYFIRPTTFYVFKDNLFDHWLKKNLKKTEIDIFVGWANYWLDSLDEIRASGAKIVLESGTMHILEQQKILEEEYLLNGLKFNPINKSIINKLIREYREADYIMTPSKHVFDSFVRQGINHEKLFKIPYGVDVSKFARKDLSLQGQPLQGQPLKGQPLKKFRVIFVGSVGLQKGVQYLIKAWNMLKLPEYDSELCIVGYIESDFKQILEKTGINVVFHGPVSQENLITMYRGSTVFVLPSIQDGFGMVQAEAMACGLPTICTEHTGARELIDDGKEGFICPIRDAGFIAKKILWCYENRKACDDMGLAAWKKIQEFTWESYGDKIVDIYKSIS